MYVKTIQLEKPATADYSRLLRLRNIKYKEVDDRYYQVGNIRGEQGWILHVSSTKALVQELYNRLIPELSKEKVAFKFLQNPDYVEKTVSGAYGYTWLGKLIRIYPETTEKAIQLAKRLIELTADLTGPFIPTDSWLGGTIYTRHGSFNISPIRNGEHNNQKAAHSPDNDTNKIPFKLPPGIPWPFGEISVQHPDFNPKTLHNRYMLRGELRTKPKGRVLKALRIKGLSLKSAIIKEAKKGMCDEIGRNLAERLEWQHTLHHKLLERIHVPRVFDIFQESGNTYLAMELIRGKSLMESISTIYAQGPWNTLDYSSKTKLLIYLQDLLNIVSNFHDLGYVHRDLTPENFLVNERDKLVMIDLELTYDLNTGYPSPPYRLGTIGYMSPEQLNTKTPTIKEDIFAIGSMMIVFFTNLSPAKFDLSNVEQLKSKLSFFFDHETTIDIMIRCLDTNATLRPTIDEIKHNVDILRRQLVNTEKNNNDISITPLNVVRETTDRVLQSFASNIMAAEGMPWHSNQLQLSTELGNKRTDYSYYPGLHTGVAGALVTIAMAAKSDIPISNSLLNIYNRNLKHLQRTIIATLSEADAGLYHGASGIAIALATGMASGLIRPTEDMKLTLARCLHKGGDGLSLAKGSGGQILAILRSSQVLGGKKTAELIDMHIDNILNAQESDGAWLIDGQKKTGLSDGIAGILLSLSEYAKIISNQKVLISLDRGIKYMKKNANRSNGKVFWYISNKSTDAAMGFADGFTGIAFSLLKCYELTNDTNTLSLASTALRNFPLYTLSNDFTVSNGVSGLGLTYLEAFRITKDQEWRRRASWIASLLCNSTFDQGTESCWVTDPNQHITADLFSGNGGILQFLLEYQSSNANNFLLNDLE